MTSAEQTQTPEDNPPEGGFRRWIMNHDDSWWFIVPYITLAVVLSIVLSLFWLVVIVMVHVALEFIKQWSIEPHFGTAFSRTLWEVKLDIGLVLFGLVLALYMELTLGVLGIGNAARAGAMAGSRIIVLQRVLRAILLSLDDLAQVARVVMRRKGKSNGEAVEDALEVEEEPTGWRGKWSTGDKFTLGFTTLCILLIVGAPVITHHSVETTFETLIEELQPFPENGTALEVLEDDID